MELTRRRLMLATALGAVALPAVGDAAPQLQDRPLLSVTGKIGVHNKGSDAQFDRAMLEALGETSFVTSTPWYKGTARFDGVLMHKVMQAVQATGDRVTAVALNDYTTDIPVSDFEKFGVLLALKRDGEYMPIRDKGPLFIIYPFDLYPELQTQKYYSRSAWQLAKLIVM